MISCPDVFIGEQLGDWIFDGSPVFPAGGGAALMVLTILRRVELRETDLAAVASPRCNTLDLRGARTGTPLKARRPCSARVQVEKRPGGPGRESSWV